MGAGLQGARTSGANTKAKPPADVPPSLRAEVIAAAQRDAGEAYAVREDAGAMRASARDFSVRYDVEGTHFGTEGRALGRLALTRVGCEGALEAVSKAKPSVAGNRVAYGKQARELSVEEWYLTGPMGLEQGFTVPERPACAANGAELVLEIAAQGLKVRADGDALTLEAASGERYRYSDLSAKDAAGQALAARMEWTADRRIALIVDASDAAFPVEVDPLVWLEQKKLLASDGAAGDNLGYSVALSGDTALVGAFSDDDKGLDSGSAYAFVRSGTSWSLQAKLLASDGAAGERFGWSTALSGDTALVGATDSWDMGPGSTYVFERSGASWVQQAKLMASDGVAGDNFGFSVALSGDTALVGASLDDDNGGNSGSAYVFVRSGTSWTQQMKLTPSDGAADDNFGSSVALSGDTALIGAFVDGDKGPACGSAYVFVRSAASWTQQAKLLAADAAATDWFGFSVALSGDTALIGANGDNDKGANSGSAYVFVRAGTSWAQQGKLTASDGAMDDNFGLSVALSGDTALVGAADFYQIGKGSAYVFTLEKGANGDPCTAASECASGFCVDGVCCNEACAGGASDCQACGVAAGAATDGTCGPSTGNSCDDGDACTQTDTCQSGTCTGSNLVTCTAQDDCHDVGTCDTSTGSCSNPPKSDGATCSTGTCQGGSCQPSGTGGAVGTGGIGGASTGGASGSAAGGANSSSSSDDSGCGCRATGSERNSHAAWLLLALGLAMARRRRAVA